MFRHTIILSLILASLFQQSALAYYDFNQDQIKKLVANELIIKYRKRTVRQLKQVSTLSSLKNDPENDLIDSIALKYRLALRTQGTRRHRTLSLPKLARNTHGRLKNSSFALLKLDEDLTEDELMDLTKKIAIYKVDNETYEVEGVYPNYIYETVASTNDPMFAEQWGLPKIKADKAWDDTQGEGVVVAVIDTGVDYQHKDLAPNIWLNSGEIPDNNIDDDRNGFVDDVRGWDFVETGTFNCSAGEDCEKRDNDPMDFDGHGTHCSGIIAAVQNNNLGISGVAPKAKIMPLRAAFSVSSGGAQLRSSDIIEAISYAINSKADIINMSFAGPQLDVLEDILRLADEVGIVLVAAAGNSSSNSITYPAGLDKVIAVGSVDFNGSRSYFSNYGDWVDIAAPGSNILSASPKNNYTVKSGTSMSAPFVAGVAALVKSKSKVSALSNQEVRDRILSSALPTDFPKDESGIATLGALNANINYPLEVDEMDFPSQAIVNKDVNFSGKGSDSTSTVVNYEWKSDLDGLLSDQAEFTINNLSFGLHSISLRVQNSRGEWSEPTSKLLSVVEGKQVAPANVQQIPLKIVKRKGRLIARFPRKDKSNITEYQWLSSKDGLIGRGRAVPTSQLSHGLHKVSLVIKDKNGVWSSPWEKIVEIKA